jgi:hypothetical protein
MFSLISRPPSVHEFLTGTKTVDVCVVAGMAQTVDELRNEIRIAVGRFERGGSTAFTKEDLAAVCDAVGYEIDTSRRLPPKAEMRAGILRKIGAAEEPNPEDTPSSFRKDELEAIMAGIQ